MDPGVTGQGKGAGQLKVAVASGKGGTGKTMVTASLAVSAVSGTGLAVIVTEPAPSGIHDLRCVVELCQHFNFPMAVIINKSDLNSIKADEIHSLCEDSGLPLVAELSHDNMFVDALVKGHAITEYSNGHASQQLRTAWSKILNLLALPEAA